MTSEFLTEVQTSKNLLYWLQLVHCQVECGFPQLVHSLQVKIAIDKMTRGIIEKYMYLQIFFT